MKYNLFVDKYTHIHITVKKRWWDKCGGKKSWGNLRMLKLLKTGIQTCNLAIELLDHCLKDISYHEVNLAARRVVNSDALEAMCYKLKT